MRKPQGRVLDGDIFSFASVHMMLVRDALHLIRVAPA
jgi:hypothetical protein